MPKCCPCQKKGRCISCACVKAGNRCSDCWPSTAGQCRNQQHSDELNSQSLSVASSLPSHSSPPCVSSSSGEVNLINTFNIANRAPQVPMTLLPANYHWGDLDGSSLEQTINAASEVVVHWRQNTFLVPYGKGGCQFVRELARLYRAYAHATVLESVALKACAILPHSCCKSLIQRASLRSTVLILLEGYLFGKGWVCRVAERRSLYSE